MSWYPICDWAPCYSRAKFRDPGLGVNWCGAVRCEEMILYSRKNYVMSHAAFPHLDPRQRMHLRAQIALRWRRITWPRLLQWVAASSLRFLAEFSRQLFLLFARIVAESWWKGPESLDYEVTLSGRKT